MVSSCGIYLHVVSLDSSFSDLYGKKAFFQILAAYHSLHSKLICFESSFTYVLAMIKLKIIHCRIQSFTTAQFLQAVT